MKRYLFPLLTALLLSTSSLAQTVVLELNTQWAVANAWPDQLPAVPHASIDLYGGIDKVTIPHTPTPMEFGALHKCAQLDGH